jgi:hypothetical protein
MQLFRRLFHPFNKSERSFPADIQKETVVADKRTLTDMFRLHLNNLPLNDFTEGKIEVNANGELIRTYSKMLDYKECGVFDSVLVKLTGNKSVNIIFRCSEPALVDEDSLRRVIDDLYDIYGQDNNHSGLCGSPTSNNNSDQQFYVLFGRDWMDYPKYKYPVSVRRYAEDVFISIWGFTLQEMITDK